MVPVRIAAVQASCVPVNACGLVDKAAVAALTGKPLENLVFQLPHGAEKNPPVFLFMLFKPGLSVVEAEVPHKINSAGRKSLKHIHHPLFPV
jgi:hypothetical protein